MTVAEKNYTTVQNYKLNQDSILSTFSYLAVATGIVFYIAGIAVAAYGGSSYEAATLDRLAVRGVGCAVAFVLVVIGLALNRPKNLAPWLFIAILVFSYTLRPLLQNTGHISGFDGWVVFAVIFLQRAADCAALIAIVLLRRTDRVTDTRIEIAIVLCAYLTVALLVVAVPSWRAFEQLPIRLAFSVVVPVGYVIVVGLVARLVFIDKLNGRAFQFLIGAWIINILFDVIGFNVFDFHNSIVGSAIFDVYGLAAFLFAAAALQPSMHLVTEPATEARPDWSFLRSASIVAAATVPMVVMTFVVTQKETLTGIGVIIVGMSIFLLLTLRARLAVDASAKAMQQLNFLATNDILSGLPNRRGIAVEALAKGDAIGIIYINIDRFQLLNNVHGHQFGNQLIKQISGRLRALEAPIFAAARIGGNEFTLLFENKSDNAVSEAKHAVEAVFAAPFKVGEIEAALSASIGIATADGPLDPSGKSNWPMALENESLNDVFRAADIAQYYAKTAGGGVTRIYSKEMEIAQRRQQEVQDCFRTIGEDDHFWLAYQAIVDLRSGRVVGAEALARLTCPTLGPVSPGEFIPVAEKNGKIEALGEWVFSLALREIAEAHDDLPADFKVSINVSPLQLRSERLLRKALDAAANTPHIAARIRLEITESTFIDDLSLSRIRSLQEAGYSIAIDDFGSEYASLQYLARLKTDVLKLDRSFTCRISEPASRAIVNHVIQIAGEMNVTVVAEGVETEAERRALAKMGCHLGQGFLWERPTAGLDRYCVQEPQAMRSSG